MVKNVLVNSASLRNRSNSEALAGTLFAGGVTAPGEMEGHPALKEAYDMEKEI